MRAEFSSEANSPLIDMHDVEAKNPTLPSSFFVRPPRAREKNVPGKTIAWPWYGRDGWKGGKAGSVEMHVVARVTTRKSPPSSRRI